MKKDEVWFIACFPPAFVLAQVINFQLRFLDFVAAQSSPLSLKKLDSYLLAEASYANYSTIIIHGGIIIAFAAFILWSTDVRNKAAAYIMLSLSLVMCVISANEAIIGYVVAEFYSKASVATAASAFALWTSISLAPTIEE